MLHCLFSFSFHASVLQFNDNNDIATTPPTTTTTTTVTESSRYKQISQSKLKDQMC